MPAEEKTIAELLNTDEAKAAMAAVLKTEQGKWEKDQEGLVNSKNKLLDELKTAKESLKLWDGLDNEQIKNLMERMSNDEETKLLAEGKVDEVISRRTDAMQRDHEHQVLTLNEKIEELTGVIGKKDERLTVMTVDGQIREAYSGLNFEPTALDDVIRLGRTVFKMDDNGKAVPRDGDGQVMFGKDGKSQMTSSEWLENLADSKKYLRPASGGGGAQNNGKGGKGFDMSTATSTQKIAEGLRKQGME